MTLKILSKKTLLGGVAAIGLSGAFFAGGVVNPVTPVFAEAVRVEAPQAPSFADVVEAVSPAVVSVRVKAKVQPASNGGRNMLEGFGFDQLPEDHPLKRFLTIRGVIVNSGAIVNVVVKETDADPVVLECHKVLGSSFLTTDISSPTIMS